MAKKNTPCYWNDQIVCYILYVIFQSLHYGVRGLAVVEPVVLVKNLEHEHVKRIVMVF